jgi:tetratricopeptide (TPR) repeat protein
MRMFRRFHWALHFAALIAAGLLLCVSAAADDGLSASTSAGYARLIFAPEGRGEVKAQLIGSILTVSFTQPTSIKPAAVLQASSGYIASGRIDPDRKTLRFALSQSVRLHVSSAGGRTAVDLLPSGYKGTPPPLAPLAGPPKPKPVDMDKLDGLKVRSGSYRNFTRIVFDWPRSVPYKVVPAHGRLTIRFGVPAKPDFSAVERQAPPWVKASGWHIDGQDTVVELTTDSDSGFHDFRDGTYVVVDILAPKTDANAYQPPGGGKVSVTSFGKGAGSSLSDAQSRQIETAAAKLNGTNLSPPHAKPAEPKPAAVSDNGKLTAEAKTNRDGAVITLANGANRKAAVFKRGNDVWIVLLDNVPFDADAMRNQLGDTVSVADAVAANGVSVLRLTLRRPLEVAAFADGDAMKIALTTKPVAHGNVTAVAFTRLQDDYAHVILNAVLNGAAKSVTLNDPAAKDQIVAVPGNLGQSVPSERTYVEFKALPTAAGVALTPFVDDLSVKVDSPRIAISRSGGLALTQSAASTLTMPVHTAAGGEQAFLDFAVWGRLSNGSFLATQRQLRDQLVHAHGNGAVLARLALARFYLANGFSAEALGMLNLLAAGNPSDKVALQIQVMRAAADYRMGRYRDACNAIAGAGLDTNRHVMLWRGLIHAAMGDADGAAAELDLAMPVLNRYIPALQAEVRLAAANAALTLGRNDAAKAQIARLSANLPPELAAEATLARGRLASAWGDMSQATHRFAEAEKNGNNETAAKAIYYRIDGALKANRLPAAAAINALERLRFRWRGDNLELMTLNRLSSLYFKEKRWRDGLATLRVAAKYFPTSDFGIKAQDQMRSIFAALYLKGKADSMKPTEALGLFYDFVDLTPIGPEGDEMIRKMADRLVSVDLFDPAEELLQYQVTKRLDNGMARAQVAARLAMIQMLDHKPKEALNTLTSTGISTMPDDVRYQRLLLQARALMELKRWDEAIDLIDVDNTPETAKLRAEIYWQSGNWTVAAQKSEQMLGNRWHDGPALSAEERQLTMRAAIAYSLAGDEPSLERVRARFTVKMKQTPDAEAFAVVTQRIDMQGMAFREAASKVAAVDSLRTFVKNLQKLN